MIQRIQSDYVTADVVTEVGHIAPVSFRLDGQRLVQPYSLPPWDSENCDVGIPAVQWIRGDFFGFPFGVSEGIEHVHGPAANGPWQVAEVSDHALRLSLDMPDLGGAIEKFVELREGHRVLYNQHTITGVDGRYNYGHHPVLHIPDGQIAQIRTSEFKFASVYPRSVEPEAGETCVLKHGAEFESLSEVPLSDGGTLSVAEYPSATRHEDLLMVSSVDGVALGWTAVSFEGYVWISIRSTVQFPSTLFWLTNGGRSGAPWNGKHDRRIGIEDLCSCFCDGAHISGKEPLADHGIPCSKLFTSAKLTVIRHAQMVVPTDGQKAVASISPIRGHDCIHVRFEDESETNEALDWKWLKETDES